MNTTLNKDIVMIIAGYLDEETKISLANTIKNTNPSIACALFQTVLNDLLCYRTKIEADIAFICQKLDYIDSLFNTVSN
jgi:hypothetical protein